MPRALLQFIVKLYGIPINSYGGKHCFEVYGFQVVFMEKLKKCV